MTGFQIVLMILAILVVVLIVMALVAPRRLVRMIFRPLLWLLYRHQVVGLENLPRDAGCVVVCNHVSWVDGILLLWMLPRNVRFIVDAGNFRNRFMEWLAGAFDTILMNENPKSIARALKAGRTALAEGEVVGIFPEGTLSRTGQLQGFKAGLTRVLKGSTAPVVPMWLDGMWGSIFSFSGGRFFLKWPERWFRRRLTLYIGKPLPSDVALGTLRNRVQELCATASIDHRDELPLVASRVLRSWKASGRRMRAADSTGTEASGRDLMIRTLALRRVLRRELLASDEQFIGVLLPPSVAGVVTNVALAIDRRVSVNLNYTVSSDVLDYCTNELGIKHVLSSERFISKLDLKLSSTVVPLESFKDKVTGVDKLVAFLQAVLLPLGLLERWLGLKAVAGDDLLTVIFTSGSTGMPKGVMLTQANISHNVDAISRAVRLSGDDSVLGILPFFHSFGYSVTLWAAMGLDTRGVYHFNPLDARQIGKLAQQYKATVLLGTPTFLRGYLRRIEPEQFGSLDVVVVGAEKMPADLFESFEKRFAVRPVEGFGATELSPLVSVNIPPSRSEAKHQCDRVEGSVGRPVPGVAVKIVSTEDGAEMPAGENGMLLVMGPNVMRGYANDDEKTRKAIQDGWYVTGDIAHVDAAGFLHITGRLSRFSKIGGEMVPHIQVENELAKLLSEGDDDEQLRVCVTAVADQKKGERLIVLHSATDRLVEDLRAGLRAAGLTNLYVPGAESFFEVGEIPVLGTGKLDLKRTRELAEELTSATVEQ